MKNKFNTITIINLIAAVLFILAGVVGDNKVFIPIGCCYIAIGIANLRNRNANNK